MFWAITIVVVVGDRGGLLVFHHKSLCDEQEDPI